MILIMQIRILGKSHQIENDMKAPQRLFSLIEEVLQGTEYHFSHLVIDGIEIYDRFEETIIQSIDQIQQIDVKVKTIEEFIWDCLISTRDYLNRAIPEIEHLNDQLYQGPDQSTWSLFLDLLDGLQWIHQMISMLNDVDLAPINKDVFRVIDSQLLQHYATLEEGLQNQDHVLVADVIQYELTPLLEDLNHEIDSSLEEKHHDTH